MEETKESEETEQVYISDNNVTESLNDDFILAKGQEEDQDFQKLEKFEYFIQRKSVRIPPKIPRKT